MTDNENVLRTEDRIKKSLENTERERERESERERERERVRERHV